MSDFAERPAGPDLIGNAIKHFEYGVTHDVFSEPVTSYAVLAVDALRKQQETGLYRFYYCESEDSYLLGMRVGNFFYAHWNGKSFEWDMSRYLPWGEHVVNPATAWKEHTYPSEPVEISADEWMNGMLRKARQAEEKPLTLDELREMDGQPVWIVEYPDWGHWELAEDAGDYLTDRYEEFYNMRYDDREGHGGLHKLGWLAYRRKPRGETGQNQ